MRMNLELFFFFFFFGYLIIKNFIKQVQVRESNALLKIKMTGKTVCVFES